MATRRRLVALSALASCLLSSRLALSAEHPRVLFGAGDVASIRQRLSGPLKPIGDAVRAGVEYPFTGGDFPKTPDLSYQYFDDRRAIADTVFAYAFAAMVWGNDESDPVGQHANQLAHDYMVGVCKYDNWVFPETQDSPTPDLNLGHFLFSVSLAYDVAGDKLSASEQKLCRDKIALEGAKMYQAATNAAWWVEEYLQNHNWVDHGGLGIAALALDGEIDADTKAWLKVANDDFAKVKTVLDLIEGGAWHEGPGYLNYGLDALIPFSLANQRAGGEAWADVAIVRDYPRFRLYAMPPAVEHRREYMVYGDYSGFQEDNTVLPLWYAARTQKDPLAAFAAGYFSGGKANGKKGFGSWPPGQRGPLLASVVYDEGVTAAEAPKGGAAWSLDDFAADLSFFAARSGFDDADSMLGLKSGVYGGKGNFDRLKVGGAPGGSLDWGHDHADDMSVYFFADGEWMTTTVPAYFIGRDNGTPEGNRTRYANSLLVDDTGQLGEGIRSGSIQDAPWFFDRQSSIPLRGSTSHYAFALGAGSKLYDPDLGLKTFGRAVLFVDRQVPVVRDVVELASPKKVDVVWHAIDQASKEGDWLRLGAKNDRVLGIRVVSPPQWDVSTEDQWAVHTDKFDLDDGHLTAAMVHPSSPSSKVTFLEALVPARTTTWASKGTVDPIDPATPETGVVLTGIGGGSDRSDVVMTEAPTASASAAGVSVVGMAGARRVSGGKTARAVVAAGQKLTLDGTDWIEITSGSPATVEVEVVPDGVALSGDEVDVRVYAPGAKAVTRNGAPVSFTPDGDHVLVGMGQGSGGSSGAAGSPGSGGSGAGGKAGGPTAGAGGSAGSGGKPAGGAGGASGQGAASGKGGSGGSGGAAGKAAGGSGGAPGKAGAGDAGASAASSEDTGEDGGCSSSGRQARGLGSLWLALLGAAAVGRRTRR